MSTSSLFYFTPTSLPPGWDPQNHAVAFQAIVIFEASESLREEMKKILPEGFYITQLLSKVHSDQLLVRAFKNGVSHPLAQSLANVLHLEEKQIRVDQLVFYSGELGQALLKDLEASWKEPAIEELKTIPFKNWMELQSKRPVPKKREDDSFVVMEAEQWGLEFTPEEKDVLRLEARRRGRLWNRAELELFAQTWSEHCKHKIFAALIESEDTLAPVTNGLFQTHIRKPSLEIIAKDPKKRALSVFHDNAGILKLFDADGAETKWAFCIKMETHNSPSAISPYGGASTGVVGVHRDILGSGLGALPVANWDVLCFESPDHHEARPTNALSPELVRLGVIKGIEDGGNQSGIPTVQGSVVFDPSFAVKPLVYAGCLGILPQEYADKKPKVGMKLYCFGGAVGLDGLRGAVMSSRDLRSEDFVGSAVQVANAFTQRRLTDFLLEARDLGLVDVVTDNGAGGLASSVGEMALSTNGATIDLTNLRLKYEGLHGWERLLSESQERMTVATESPEKLEALALEWDIPFDRLGELNNSGVLLIHYLDKVLVEIPLDTLHESCPQLKLKSSWTAAKEKSTLDKKNRPLKKINLAQDFVRMLESVHLCSREQVIRRFDHEVQGRTLKKPFAGETQHSPQDGSLLEVYEAWQKKKEDVSIVLSHGLSPQRANILENVVFSFDEALRTAVLSGVQSETLAALDNFCWSDPIPTPQNPEGERRLWRLVRSCEVLSQLAEEFSIPFVSGKDSMKNNSKDFEALQTVVVSMAGSAHSKYVAPSSFFSRANDIVFYLPLLKPTLKDSTWARVMESGVEKSELFAEDPKKCQEDVKKLARSLKTRYAAIEALIKKGKLRSVKDISEGGLLTTIFEMCLGKHLGFIYEDENKNEAFYFEEGLGGLVFAVDPHFARETAQQIPEARRLGVVMKEPLLKFGTQLEFSVLDLEKNYLKKGQEGFWG